MLKEVTDTGLNFCEQENTFIIKRYTLFTLILVDTLYFLLGLTENFTLNYSPNCTTNLERNIIVLGVKESNHSVMGPLVSFKGCYKRRKS